jgi:hypothetical protein
MMRLSANMTNNDQPVKPMEVKLEEGSDRGCRGDRNNHPSHAARGYLFENRPALSRGHLTRWRSGCAVNAENSKT